MAKFCMWCQKQLPDEANFCPQCGAKTVEGIVIDAPPGSTVTISDAPPPGFPPINGQKT
ncbi:MAG: zinc-ribbon domain-containing protein [Ruminococcaceae bacterium]|nr:zinc-ribbon domain-containing protein [Oscillospiraceae bacterium]